MWNRTWRPSALTPSRRGPPIGTPSTVGHRYRRSAAGRAYEQPAVGADAAGTVGRVGQPAAVRCSGARRHHDLCDSSVTGSPPANSVTWPAKVIGVSTLTLPLAYCACALMTQLRRRGCGPVLQAGAKGLIAGDHGFARTCRRHATVVVLPVRGPSSTSWLLGVDAGTVQKTTRAPGPKSGAGHGHRDGADVGRYSGTGSPRDTSAPGVCAATAKVSGDTAPSAGAARRVRRR